MSKPHIIMFNVRATPLPTDPDGAENFYYALGVLMVAWGRLEGHFTLTLINLMRIAGVNSVSHQLPISWKSRAGLWRKAFAAIPFLAPIKKEAENLLDKIVDTAQDRHILIHAIWEEFKPGDPTKMDISTIKHKRSTDDGLELKRVTIELDMLKKIIVQINQHNRSLANISFYLSSNFPAPKDAQIL
jgi:hypothetical protein